MAETGMVRKAIEAAGIKRRTAFYWRSTRADFKAAWDAALEVAASTLEDEAIRRARDGVEKPIVRDGELVGTTHEYSDTLLIFLMKAANPAKYRERHVIEGGDKPVEVVAKVDIVQVAREIAFGLALGAAKAKEEGE